MFWQAYQRRISTNEKRSSWVKEIYEAATKYLLDVRQTFQNYTLHDETHILNGCYGIGVEYSEEKIVEEKVYTRDVFKRD